MLLYTILVCAYVCTLEAHFSNIISNASRKQLVSVIKAINGDDGDMREDDNDLNEDEKEEILQEILRLLKKNYHPAKRDENNVNPVHDGARLYFIRNPEVLDEYKNYLKAKISSPISYNPRGDVSRYEENTMQDNLKKLKKGMFHSDIDQNSEDDDLDNEDIKETRKDNYRGEKIPQGAFDLNYDNDLSNEDIRNKKYEKNYKSKKDKFLNDDVKLKVDVDSDFKSNSDETLNRKVKSKNLLKYKGKSNKIIKMESIEDYKKREHKILSKPKSNYSYRKPSNEKVIFSFGRTHIPFVGKRGIYDDK